MFRGSVILFALVVNARTIWQALYLQTISVETAVIHFLIAVPVCAVLLWILRMTFNRPAPVESDELAEEAGAPRSRGARDRP
ncbi:hypothetical protein SAMN05892883_0849 [Jatrophihabitans sp. GAS493]|uniref:hypothetical protein n=1 Tax=Jatrophihabitans sp. GAS493 TaxID=1907575 RepID=UPI000BB75191|nr:hypothetical protein [Jatrophihabitans sp. GAS493]SOD71309.1 hypothetical protein SAMN05892883_0849 [Jatrophihabitans sp. GAS493]